MSCIFGYSMPASILQLIYVPLNHPGRGYRWACFLEVLVKNIQLPAVDMILFRNKENLISTWLKVSQRTENQVPEFKHGCPLSYYLVINIYYLVLQISKLKCCPLTVRSLRETIYAIFPFKSVLKVTVWSHSWHWVSAQEWIRTK